MRAATGPGESLSLDLERSTTDFFTITNAAPDPSAPGVWNVTLVPLALGKLKLPLYWKVSRGAASGEIETDVALEVVEPAGPPASELADIKRPIAARPALWPWLLALLGFIAAWQLWRRAAARGGEEASAGDEKEALPPEVVAEYELSALASSTLWDEGRFKEFYARMTDTLRRYLERRYAMSATKLTTHELYREMRQAELDAGLIRDFRALFDRADLVKFSKILPERAWGSADVDAALRLVRETTPKPRVQGAAA